MPQAGSGEQDLCASPSHCFLQTERQGSKQPRKLAAVKMNEPKRLTTTWMDLKHMVLSERIQTMDSIHTPHERLPEILVVPREKTPTGAAARGNP